MLGNKERNAVIQNLKDAGCSERFVERFLVCYDKGEKEGQMKLLELWRADLLEQVHIGENRISCLDYLVYRLEKAKA
jgi:hypothetical protein